MPDPINTKAKVLFAAVLLVALVAGAAASVFSWSRYKTYQLYTGDPVSGLLVDAPIEFHGVEVGKVKSIKLINPHYVGIVVSIDKDAPVTSASTATITARGLATRGFTGYVYIAIEDAPGNAGAAARPLITQPGERYPVIPTAPSRTVTLDTTISQVSDDVRALTALLQSLLDKQTVGSLKESADGLRQVLPEAHKALAALTELATRLNRDPAMLIRGKAKPTPGPGERK